MIRTAGLGYSYSGKKSLGFPDFEVAKGEHCLLLGDSGSGKTTLLHLLGGLLTSQQGKIELNGVEISSLSESSLDKFRGQHLGFVFQKNHLIPALNVRKNLLLAPFLSGMKVKESRVKEILSHLDLSDKENAKISELSQGQAQRVAIARAVLNKPSIIFADEPTSALDDKNCGRVIELLMKTSEQYNATLVVATHDQRLKNRIRRVIQL